MVSEQIPLNVAVTTQYKFDNYFSGSNRQSVDWLRGFAETLLQDKTVLIWGGAGVGKTHLLSALCNHHNDLGLGSFYLPLECFEEYKPEVIENIESCGFVVLDNVHKVSGNLAWETALFDLYNRILERDGQLLMSSNCSPQLIPFKLADLKSRMMQCLALRIEELSEDEKIQVLRQRAEQKGLNINGDVFLFLLRHYPRDLKTMMRALEQLDRDSLIKKRRITIPFVKEVMGMGTTA